MKEVTRKLLPGRLLLATSLFNFLTAVVRPEKRGFFLALGLYFLIVGITWIRRARNQQQPAV